MKEIVFKKEVNDKFLTDIGITAAEGGINYWGKLINYTDYLHGGEAVIGITEDCDDLDDSYIFNNDVIAQGLNNIFSKDASQMICNRAIRNTIMSAIINNDSGDIDAECAEVIVQAGLFNELIYG